MQEQTIFDILYPKFKINKPIRLITLFSGYDSQALALKYLGVDFELYKTCEWAVKSIQALKDLHFPYDNNDYSLTLDIDEVKEFLFKKGISSNYNDPMNKKQIDRMSEQYARKIFNNIIATRNLVNIQQVKGKQLEIRDTDKYTYIMTYSFPCQDLSLAGKGKGMSDTSTRSGMLWEVERILTELKDKPQMLLMENVPQVHNEENIKDFKKWITRLEELGYKNYCQDLIATDYGIPQTRNRTFMISLLGDYNYTFPKPIPLKLRLKDMLEDNVDEKYYLSDKMINYVLNRTPIGEKDNYANNIIGNDAEKNAGTITTKGSNSGTSCRSCDNFIVDNMTQNDVDEQIYLKVRNANSKGYLEATEGDGINIQARMEYQRGNVQKGKAHTLNTMGGENEGVVVLGNYSPSNHEASRIIDSEYSAPTIKENHGTINATQTSDLRIRKLTPRECFRLMGVKDEDFEKCAKNQSDSSLYHLAGDSIVVNVLMAIFKEVL